VNQENINSNRAVLYVRPFSGEEATKARAIQYQRAQLEEFCRQRGWKVVGEYVDKLGAVPGRRPGFNKMLKDVQNGKLWFDRLVVHSVSRFGRNMAEVDFAIQSLRQRGIQVVSTTVEISDHEMDLLFGRFTVLFDEYSSQQASEQVRRAMRKNAQLGFYCGGAAP